MIEQNFDNQKRQNQPNQNTEDKGSFETKKEPAAKIETHPLKQGQDKNKELVEKRKNTLFNIFTIVSIIILLLLAYFLFLHKGTVILKVEPKDAKIFIDGKESSKETEAPEIKLKIKPGKHLLSLEKSGYIKKEQEIEVFYFKKIKLSFSLKIKPEVQLVSDKNGIHLALSAAGDYLNFYSPKDSAFYRLKLNEEAEEKAKLVQATPACIKNLVSVSWSPNLEVAAIKIKNNNRLLKKTPFYKPKIKQGTITTWIYDFGRYDLLRQRAYFLGTDIGNLVFSSDSEKIAYFYRPASGERSLIIADKNNENKERAVSLTGFGEPKFSWSKDKRYLAIVKQSKNYDQNQVYLFNTISKELTPLTDQGNTLDAKFGPKNNKIIYSVYSRDPESNIYSILNLVERESKQKRELGIRAFSNQIDFYQDGEKVVLFGIIKNEKGFFVYNLEEGRGEKLYYQGAKGFEASEVNFLEKNGVIYFNAFNKIFSLRLETGY